MKRLLVEEAKNLVVGALTRRSIEVKVASSVAKALIGAELIGQVGHGLRRMPTYVEQVEAKKIQKQAIATCQRICDNVLKLDAASGFAYPALDLAIEALPPLAEEKGICLALITRSHHCGAAGLIVEQLARKGLVALLFANTPAAIAPWGGTRPVLGTNPIAFAAPRERADPLIIDLSLSKVARGKIVAAAQKGEKIPEGWALKDGEPTTDPREGLAGTMAPIGDAKGVALALMVEILVGGMTGSNFSYEASSFLDGKGPAPSTGQVILVLNPGNCGADRYFERIEGLMHTMVAQDGTRLPFAQRYALREKQQKEGFLIDEDLYQRYKNLSMTGG